MTEEARNTHPAPEGENETFVMIPENHEEAGVVPICIRCIDDRGHRVNRGWIEAARPIAEHLRHLARHVMRDIARVSELAEGSVHTLSARFGDQLGRNPSVRIWVDAKWRARHLAAGGRRIYSGKEVQLLDHMSAVLKEPYDFESALLDRDLLERLRDRLRQLGREDIVEVMDTYLANPDDQIPELFGAKCRRAKSTFWKQFHRCADKAIELLDRIDKRAA
jgi:hypothetical protein